jgi:hypothetical protein
LSRRAASHLLDFFDPTNVGPNLPPHRCPSTTTPSELPMDGGTSAIWPTGLQFPKAEHFFFHSVPAQLLPKMVHKLLKSRG